MALSVPSALTVPSPPTGSTAPLAIDKLRLPGFSLSAFELVVSSVTVPPESSSCAASAGVASARPTLRASTAEQSCWRDLLMLTSCRAMRGPEPGPVVPRD